MRPLSRGLRPYWDRSAHAFSLGPGPDCISAADRDRSGAFHPGVRERQARSRYAACRSARTTHWGRVRGQYISSASRGSILAVQNLFRGSSNGWGFWETSAYIGGFWIPALLAVNSPRRVAPWLITAVIIYALAQGDAGLLWPWATACRSCRPCGFHRGF